MLNYQRVSWFDPNALAKPSENVTEALDQLLFVLCRLLFQCLDLGQRRLPWIQSNRAKADSVCLYPWDFSRIPFSESSTRKVMKSEGNLTIILWIVGTLMEVIIVIWKWNALRFAQGLLVLLQTPLCLDASLRSAWNIPHHTHIVQWDRGETASTLQAPHKSTQFDRKFSFPHDSTWFHNVHPSPVLFRERSCFLHDWFIVILLATILVHRMHRCSSLCREALHFQQSPRSCGLSNGCAQL